MLLSLLLTGCSAAEPAAPVTLLTPLEAAQITDVSLLDPADVEALSVFFSRWGAYMASVGLEAQDESDIYSGLYAYTTSWKQAVSADTVDGGCKVVLYLPATPGLVEVDALEGSVRTASVSYDSEDAEVRASMAFTVACNALIYALSDVDDMNVAAAVYNECMKRLHASGAEMAGIVEQGGYAYVLTLTADDQNMRLSAMEAEP